MANIEEDCKRRIERKEKGEPMRFLLTIGGAGAQKEIFALHVKKDILLRIVILYAHWLMIQVYNVI